MGPGRNYLTRVRSIFCCSGRVKSVMFGLGLENFPLKYAKF